MSAPHPGALRALIFDLDGVIVDSQELMRLALAESFRRHGLAEAPPYSDFFRLMGRPLEEILAALGLPAGMADTYRRVSRENLHRAAPYDGVPALLETCRARGLAVGLLTGKDRARTEEVLRLFRLRGAFRLVVCGDDPLPQKPAPGGLTALLAAFGVRPDRGALVGDSPHDMACARAAGAGALGAGWGFTSATELRASGAGLIFHSPWELCAWLQAGLARGLPEIDARGVSHG
jgi:HAD superfamily hydrolase (TIGR01509 family)